MLEPVTPANALSPALRSGAGEVRRSGSEGWPREADPTYIPALDGLRGIAALLALYCHAAQQDAAAMSGAIENLVLITARLSWISADAFFVLSGFLITGMLLDARERPRLFRDFYARRAVRIIPLYYAFLAIVFLVLPLLGAFAQMFGTYHPPAITYWLFLSNISQPWTRELELITDHVVSPAWILALEVQFYLLWPLVVVFFRRQTLLNFCVGLFFGSMGVRAGLELSGYTYLATYLPPCRVDGLAVGAALALLAREPGGLRWLVRPAWILIPVCLVAMLGIIAVMQKMGYRRGPGYSPGYVIFGSGLSSLIFGSMTVLALESAKGSWLNRAFSFPILRTFGKYSYGLFLLHLPVFILVSTYIFPPAGLRMAGTHLPGLLVYFAITFTLSLLAAMLSWHVLEKHFLRLKPSIRTGTSRAD